MFGEDLLRFENFGPVWFLFLKTGKQGEHWFFLFLKKTLRAYLVPFLKLLSCFSVLKKQ